MLTLNLPPPTMALGVNLASVPRGVLASGVAYLVPTLALLTQSPLVDPRILMRPLLLQRLSALRTILFPVTCSLRLSLYSLWIVL